MQNVNANAIVWVLNNGENGEIENVNLLKVHVNFTIFI